MRSSGTICSLVIPLSIQVPNIPSNRPVSCTAQLSESGACVVVLYLDRLTTVVDLLDLTCSFSVD